MYVSALAETANTRSTAAAAPQTVDYQSFLRLLVTQMKNQDPTAPMDATDYVAQLATFSQVEQSIQINSKLDAMIQASTLSQATGLIGREIETMDGKASGVVKQVELYSDGAVLVLENGTKVPMSAGIVVRDTKETTETTENTENTENTESTET